MQNINPKSTKLLIPLLIVLFAACSTTPKGLELKSPNEQLEVALSVDNSLQFILHFKGSEVITLDRMGFQFEEYPDFGKNLEAKVSGRGSVNQQWKPIGAKNSPVADHYNYMTVTLTEKYKVLAGEIGEYMLVARKKDRKWFIGAMTNSQPRTIPLDLSLIPGLADKVSIRIWQDATDADKNPTHLDFVQDTLDRNALIEIKTAPGGGYVAIIG